MSSSASYDNGQLVITRLFDAPRSIIFDAWIETSKVQLWWGCVVAGSVESIIEARVGGQYSHNMTLDNGSDYQHHGIITQYEPPKLLAYRLYDRFHDEVMMIRVEFTEANDMTTVRLTQDNLSEKYCKFVMAGWQDSFEKLAILLRQTREELAKPQ